MEQPIERAERIKHNVEKYLKSLGIDEELDSKKVAYILSMAEKYKRVLRKLAKE